MSRPLFPTRNTLLVLSGLICFVSILSGYVTVWNLEQEWEVCVQAHKDRYHDQCMQRFTNNSSFFSIVSVPPQGYCERQATADMDIVVQIALVVSFLNCNGIRILWIFAMWCITCLAGGFVFQQH